MEYGYAVSSHGTVMSGIVEATTREEAIKKVHSSFIASQWPTCDVWERKSPVMSEAQKLMTANPIHQYSRDGYRIITSEQPEFANEAVVIDGDGKVTLVDVGYTPWQDMDDFLDVIEEKYAPYSLG